MFALRGREALVEEENLLEHFAESNKFISDALKARGAVLIHWFVNTFLALTIMASALSGWFFTKVFSTAHETQLIFFIFFPTSAMGKSRSATILTAYLMASRRLAPNLALGIIKRSRPFVEPNPGFMDQLGLYHQMEYAEDVEDHPIYQRWMYRRDVDMSNAAGRAPERVHFRDAEADVGRITRVKEGETPGKIGEVQLRCKKCRYAFSTSHVFLLMFIYPCIF
jgi:dual specificity phosphatase 12